MDTTRIRHVHWLGSRETSRLSSPCLVVIWGPDLGRKIPLEEPALTIGRDPGCDVVVPLDGISRMHCEIRAHERESVALVDMGSTNGTLVNGHPVEPRQQIPLRSGDRIELVGVVFKFLAGDDVELQYHEAIHQLAITDGLTRLFNRRFLTDFLGREISRCRRHARPLSLMLFDLDGFKQINDGHGHAAGDQVLRQLVEVARKGVRHEECLARYGGDEFAIVMPETPIEGARIVAERVRGRVEGTSFSWQGRQLAVTISAGVVSLAGAIADPDAFLAAADARLYDAKAAGRNAVRG